MLRLQATPRSRSLALPLAAILGSLLTLLVVKGVARHKIAHQQPEPDTDSQRVLGDIASIKDKIRALEFSTAAAAVRSSISQRAAPEHADLATPSAEEVQRAAKARHAEALRLLEDAFIRDSPEAAWSAEVANEFNEAMKEGTIADVAVTSLDCRSTLCKIQLHETKVGSLQGGGGGVQSLPQLSVFRNSQIYFGIDISGDGIPTATIYASRPGAKLAPLR